MGAFSSFLVTCDSFGGVWPEAAKGRERREDREDRGPLFNSTQNAVMEN